MRCPRPRKHGLELSRDGSPCESRGRSAGRRARPERARSRARGSAGSDVCRCRAANGWHAPFGASPPSFLRMILSENRTPLFGIVRCWRRRIYFVHRRRQGSGTRNAPRERCSISSSPDLIRQSMRGCGLPGFAVRAPFPAHRHGPPGQAGGDESRRGRAGKDLPFAESYPVGPSWQDCGAAGESWRQVGTSHFEQAASESPSASNETAAMRNRKGR